MFDAAAVVDDAGLLRVVTALGGVDQYVDERTTSVDIGFDTSGRLAAPYRLNPDGTPAAPVPGITPQVFEVGMRHFTPSEAVDYVRQRYLLGNNDGDYGRARHEQQLFQAVYRQLLAAGVLTDPAKLNASLTTLGEAATIDTDGVPLADWFYAMRGVAGDRLIGLNMNAGQYDTETLPSLAAVEVLSPTSTQLLRAVGDDTVDQFVAAHPDWVAPG